MTLAPEDPLVTIVHEESAILCTLEGPGFETNHDARFELYDELHRPVSPEQGYSPSQQRPAPLPNLAPGRYYLRVVPVDRQGWLSQWFDQQDSLSDATPIVVPAQGAVVPVTVHLMEGGRIRGRARWSDGTSFAGQIIVTTLGGQFVARADASSISQNGAYLVIGLPDGEYRLGAYHGWETYFWYPGTWEASSAETIRIEHHGSVEGIDLEIPE